MQTSTTYKDAGVDIEAGDTLVKTIKQLAKKTNSKGVLAGIGGFGAMFEISKEYQNPVLVSGTDGVGTKLKLAFKLNCHNTIGIDLVAMSVNDILVQGAKPLFFLDYFACGKLDLKIAEDVINGIMQGCQQANCSLIGGETAEMPDMYPLGEYDLAGFAVGVVEKAKIIDGSKLKAGDIVIGLASSGFHSNGYSLVRKMIEKDSLDLDSYYNETETWGQALLRPTKIYVKSILDLQSKIEINAMSHITGGGITGNLTRGFPENLVVNLDWDSLPKVKLFEWIKICSGLTMSAMLETFNCGVGYAVIVDINLADRTLQLLKDQGEECYVIGQVQEKDKLANFYV